MIKKNKYVAKIDGEINEMKHAQNKVLAFSAKLQKAMGLSDTNLKRASNAETYWNIGDYTVRPETRAWDGWGIHLEVMPTGDDDSWTNLSGGTMSIICPPVSIQDEILELIKNEL